MQFSNATPQRSTAQVVHYLSALHNMSAISRTVMVKNVERCFISPRLLDFDSANTVG